MASTALRIARGISRRGLSVSSPSEAAPSKPAKDRKPNTAALPTTLSDVPLGSLKALAVIEVPCGEVPAISLMPMTIFRITMRVTEMPSMPSSERAAMRMSPYARMAMMTPAAKAIQM